MKPIENPLLDNENRLDGSPLRSGNVGYEPTFEHDRGYGDEHPAEREDGEFVDVAVR